MERLKDLLSSVVAIVAIVAVVAVVNVVAVVAGVWQTGSPIIPLRSMLDDPKPIIEHGA